jgi:hypothetical protein
LQAKCTPETAQTATGTSGLLSKDRYAGAGAPAPAHEAGAPAGAPAGAHTGARAPAAPREDAGPASANGRANPPQEDDDFNYSELIPTNHRAIDAAIAGEVRRLTGTVITAEAAADIRADIIGGRQVAEPAVYVARAIKAEAGRDPALGRWLAPPEAPRPSRRAHPSNRSAAAVLEHARNPDGDPGRRPSPDTAHRGAGLARKLLAEKAAATADAAKQPRPIADIELPADPGPLERIHLEPLEPGETEYNPAEPETDDECPF